MSRAVRFDEFGDVSVLEVVAVPTPRPGPDRVVVEVRAAAINPGETAIRRGVLEKVFPTKFPSGEGSDFSGVVVAVGERVNDFAPGDEVLGWSDERSSHATHVSVPTSHLVRKPAKLSWEVAGALYVAGMAAWASVQAVAPKAGEVVVVSGAAGGVGSIAVQLVRLRGATVVAIASPRNHEWLRKLGAIPVDHDSRTIDRVREAAPAGRVDAWIDAFGGGYVDMAIQLGVPSKRINTIIDFEAVQKHGVQAEGTQSASSASSLAQLAQLVADGKVEVPIAARYRLDQVREAYDELEKRHTRGKIVLVNAPSSS
jgi:NADPH:quinone reductase-like Zn-dependent oxidoreductase